MSLSPSLSLLRRRRFAFVDEYAEVLNESRCSVAFVFPRTRRRYPKTPMEIIQSASAHRHFRSRKDPWRNIILKRRMYLEIYCDGTSSSSSSRLMSRCNNSILTFKTLSRRSFVSLIYNTPGSWKSRESARSQTCAAAGGRRYPHDGYKTCVSIARARAIYS